MLMRERERASIGTAQGSVVLKPQYNRDPEALCPVFSKHYRHHHCSGKISLALTLSAMPLALLFPAFRKHDIDAITLYVQPQ